MNNNSEDVITDEKSLDQMIIRNIGFLTINQIFRKANKNDPNNPQFSHQYIEERISALVFAPQDPENRNNVRLKKERIYNVPLSAREEYMLLFLSKNLNRYSAAELCHKYRYMFNNQTSFSSLVKLIEQSALMSPEKQYFIIERYSAEIANLEKVCPLDEFTSDELAESEIAPEDTLYVRDVLSSGDDNSIPTNSEAPIIYEDLEPQQSFEEVENGFLALTQPRAKVFAHLVMMKNIAHIRVKNYLLGDVTRTDLDFDLKLVDGYQCDSSKKVLVLIMLKNDLSFYLENVGDVIVKVNGYQIYPTETVFLCDRSLLEINGLDLAFNINRSFMYMLQNVIKKIESNV